MELIYGTDISHFMVTPKKSPKTSLLFFNHFETFSFTTFFLKRAIQAYRKYPQNMKQRPHTAQWGCYC